MSNFMMALKMSCTSKIEGVQQKHQCRHMTTSLHSRMWCEALSSVFEIVGDPPGEDFRFRENQLTTHVFLNFEVQSSYASTGEERQIREKARCTPKGDRSGDSHSIEGNFPAELVPKPLGIISLGRNDSQWLDRSIDLCSSVSNDWCSFGLAAWQVAEIHWWGEVIALWGDLHRWASQSYRHWGLWRR